MPKPKAAKPVALSPTILRLVEMVPLSKLRPNPRNPRDNAAAVPEVVKSIQQYGFNQPLVVDSAGVIIAGHTRFKAAQQLGLKAVPVLRAKHLKDREAVEYMLADNATAKLAGWENELLAGLLKEYRIKELPGMHRNDVAEIIASISYAPDKSRRANLTKTFGVPPFSVLDTRAGYWRDRRDQWEDMMGDLTRTKERVLGKGQLASLGQQINLNSSNFDPVLAEAMLRWFCPPGGRVLDPFAGEQSKGYVSGELGMEYHGVEIRADQVAVNANATKRFPHVHYYLGDAQQLAKLVPGGPYDFIFTSPPYYNLEDYGKGSGRAPSYADFMKQYRAIFAHAVDRLFTNRFLVVKVGEVRDKRTGAYHGFVPDNVRLFTDLGLRYYNEYTLISPAGTGPLRAANAMKNRKATKLHQNVLVFYKGDPLGIQKHFPVLTHADAKK